ncbi:MAG: hypothetical protein IT163_14895 [Bryobacterales bacterium]|nr:hypothetical protein [Bryobacterales bacterium]
MSHLSRAFAALAVFPLMMGAQDSDGIHWLTSYREALKEAKATGKPIFLEYRCEP